MAKLSTVSVNLHGASGTRETKIQPCEFPTRHVRTQVEAPKPALPEITPELEIIPSANELFAVHLPDHIAASRWGQYIEIDNTRIFDGRVLVYSNPSEAFWKLRNRAKRTFDDLGIYVKKSKGVWQARIPIPVLTDKVFVDSGLAAIVQSDRNASILEKMTTEIRNRQFAETQRSLHKIYRERNALREAANAAGDAVGLGAFILVSWLIYIVM